MEVDPLHILAVCLAMFLAVTVYSATGFGIGMVATPAMLWFFDPQTAVVVVGTGSAAIGVLIAYQSRRDIPYREMLPICAAGAAGAPIAVLILKNADPTALRVGIALLIILLAIGSLRNFQGTLPYARALGMAAGFIVGVVLPAFGVGGPLVMLFVLTRGWDRRAVRAAMGFYLAVLSVVMVAFYALFGLYTAERLELIAIAALPELAGLLFGFLLLKWMNERVFRIAVMVVILLSSAVVLAREALRIFL